MHMKDSLHGGCFVAFHAVDIGADAVMAEAARRGFDHCGGSAPPSIFFVGGDGGGTKEFDVSLSILKMSCVSYKLLPYS
jgi:hypothetical protein